MNIQSAWLSLKKWGKRALIAYVVIYTLLLIVNLSTTFKQHCPVERYTFQGQTFDIELCYEVVGHRDYGIGFGVYSTDGKLLAWRRGTFFPESPLNYLAIESDKIRYSDDTSDFSSASIPEDCVLHMPPTWVDWLDYRLPGGVPFLNHCGRVSEEISDKARAQWRLRTEADRDKPGSVRNPSPQPKGHSSSQ